MVARYEGARDSIADYLCDLARPTSKLIDAMSTLNSKATASESPWTKQDSLLSIEAIEAFHTAYSNNKMGVRKIECRPVVGNQPNIEIEGTQISVTLNATTHRKDKDGSDAVGGAILLFSKTETSANSRVERCRVAAVVVLLFAEKHLSYLGKADPKLCFALDIFGGAAHAAPSSYKQRLNNITAACEEVSFRWAAIEPPSDYDGPPWK